MPERADQTDPVLVQLDDERLYQWVRADLAQRYRLTPVHGRHSTPAEGLLRLLVVPHPRMNLSSEVSMHDFMRHQFEMDDDAQRISLDTVDDLLTLMAAQRCAVARILCKRPGMPVLIELPATAAVQRRVTADSEMRISKRVDLNRMAKRLKPHSPEEWMSEEQLAHYRATGDITWRSYGTSQDCRFGLG